MANIKIPKEAIHVLRKLVELDQKDFDAALAAFSAEPPTLTISQFLKKISPKFEEAKRETFCEILAVVVPLYAVKSHNSLAAGQLAEEIGGVAADMADEKFPIDKVEVLKSRLISLLNLDNPLAVIAKANEVMVEHERLFCSARILSDIRSVFAETPEKVSGAMVVHMLEIGYHHLGKHNEFYVAMDNNDLKRLKSLIERAERKTVALKALVESSKTPYLEV